MMKKILCLIFLAFMLEANVYGQGVFDGVTSDQRNKLGIVLGAEGFFDNNALGTYSEKDAETAVVFTPGVFVNLGRRRTIFHADYRFGYRMYTHHRELAARTHTGALRLRHPLSRRVQLAVSEWIRSGPSDPLNFAWLTPSVGQQLLFDQQRSTSNDLIAQVSYQNTRKNRIAVSGISNIYRHYRRDENTEATRVEFEDEYALSRGLAVTGDVSNEWVRSRSGTRNGTITRFLAGPKFKLAKTWEAIVRAGLELVDQDTGRHSAGTGEASLTHRTDLSSIDIRYWNRSGYQLGAGGLNRFDSVNINLDRTLKRWMSVHVGSLYYRTTSLQSRGVVQVASANAGLQFLLQRNLIATVSGYYLYENQRFRTEDALAADRYILYAGIHYVFPGARRVSRDRMSPNQPRIAADPTQGISNAEHAF